VNTAPAAQGSVSHTYSPAQVVTSGTKAGVTDYLPTAFGEAAEPSDILGLYMALMEEMARNGLDASEKKVELTREKIGEAMKELKKQLDEIARKLQDKEDDDDGWGFLGDVVDWVCDAVGDAFEAIGTGIEVAFDVAKGPIDIIVGAIKGENIGKLLEQEVNDLTTRGKLSKTIGEAAKGIVRFVLDVAKTVTEFAKATMNGDSPLEALTNLGKDLWGALKEDILENPAVMEVLGTVLKAVAIAAAVVSGGTLAFVAVGLFLLSDLNKEHGIAEEVFGEKAGPWVSTGIELAATVVMAVATLGADAVPGLLGDLQQVGALAGAVVQIAGGVNAVMNAIDQSELDHVHADAQGLMNRLAALQRMLDVVLSELQQRTEGRDRVHKGGAKMAEIQGEAMEAAIYYKA
jgi:hypothetical protein